MTDEVDMTGDCFICGDDRSHLLETHHVVPRRFDGDDSAENLVQLCPSCHTAVEKMYNSRFYRNLGVKGPEANPKEAITVVRDTFEEYYEQREVPVTEIESKLLQRLVDQCGVDNFCTGCYRWTTRDRVERCEHCGAKPLPRQNKADSEI